MDDFYLKSLLVSTVVVFFFAILVLIEKVDSLKKDITNLKIEAVELGYAKYNNSQWQWVTNK